MTARHAAAIIAGTFLALTVALLAALTTGHPDTAWDLAVGMAIALLGWHTLHLHARLDALDAPRGRCPHCADLITDSREHRIHCIARQPRKDHLQ